MTVLNVENLTRSFGGLTAVDGVAFCVEENEIVGLIGPNGAGKSTTFNLIMGTLEPDEGTIEYRGEPIEDLAPHERVQRGLGRTYQTPKQFDEFTVRENVRCCMLPNSISVSTQLDGYNDRADEIIDRVALEDQADVLPAKLTPGELRRLEIAKALATDPDLLLLDEVFAGITKDEAEDLAGLIRTLQSEGFSFLIVDHVMDVLMPLVDRTVVLNFGEKIAEGTADEVITDETVRKVYLGESSGVA